MKVLNYRKIPVHTYYEHIAEVELTEDELNTDKEELIIALSKQIRFPIEGYGLYYPVYKKTGDKTYLFKWQTDKSCD